MLRIALAISIIFGYSFLSYGQGSIAPKYSNEFLQIGVGARSLGMSLAQVASVNDVTAGYWNPAGLTGMKGRMQVAAMHSEYFAGIAKYDYAALSKRIDTASAIGLSVMRFGVDDIPNTTELIDAEGNIDYSRITTFSAADYAFVLSYGKKSSFLQQRFPKLGGDHFSWGASAKIIYRHLGDFARAWGFGIDAGVQWWSGKWRIGLMARDITSTFNAWSYNIDDKTQEVFLATGNEIPENTLEITLPRFIPGIGRMWKIKEIDLLTEVNFMMTTDGQRNSIISGKVFNIDPSFGFEASYKNTVFLRGGVGNFQRIKTFEGDAISLQPNIGLGLRIRSFYLDYALSDIGNVSDVLYSNVFSLKLVLREKLKAKP
ncbi:MAG: PorV/PorQ family protein [Flavobacteriales bacterium]